MADYLLPDVGEGLTEAEIVAWRVKEGDTVQINDIVVEIETAKSLVELPSPYAGVVTALLVPEGETVPVGTPIISIGDPSEKPADAPAPEAPAARDIGEIDLSNPAASGGGEGESLVGRNKADRGPVRRPRKGSASPVDRGGRRDPDAGAGRLRPGWCAVAGRRRVRRAGGARSRRHRDRRPSSAVHALAKPPVRKLAKDLGVDLATVTATGPNGSITREDVQASRRLHPDVLRTGCPGDHDVRQLRERERREPIKGVRKMMGQAMVDSAFTAPHVTEWVTVDVTRTMEFVDRLKTRREFRDVKVSPLLVLARACMLAMRRTPEVNSFWDDAGPGDRLQELRQPRHRRGHTARARRTQRQGRRAAVPARPRRGAQPARRHGARRAGPSRPR